MKTRPAWHYSFSTKPPKVHSYTLFRAQSAAIFRPLTHDIGNVHDLFGKHTKTREILISGQFTGLYDEEKTSLIAHFDALPTAKRLQPNGLNASRSCQKHIGHDEFEFSQVPTSSPISLDKTKPGAFSPCLVQLSEKHDEDSES